MRNPWVLEVGVLSDIVDIVRDVDILDGKPKWTRFAMSFAIPDVFVNDVLELLADEIPFYTIMSVPCVHREFMTKHSPAILKS